MNTVSNKVIEAVRTIAAFQIDGDILPLSDRGPDYDPEHGYEIPSDDAFESLQIAVKLCREALTS